MAFMLAGKERLPARRGQQSDAAAVPAESFTNPLSHGLAMALAWTALFGFLAARLSHDRRRGAFVSLLVFSHWLIDLIAKPMTGVFPNDSGLPLLFGGSRTVGLGLYRSRKMANLVEYGSLAVGLALYLQTPLSRRRPRPSN